MNSSNIPKRMSAREWRVYKARQRQMELQSFRIAAARSGLDMTRALAEAQRNYKHGYAVSYPAVGIRANLKYKHRY